ncbi:MAG: hypothetical protein ACKVZJ_13940 [Phycisphaerales bacterium]
MKKPMGTAGVGGRESGVGKTDSPRRRGVRGEEKDSFNAEFAENAEEGNRERERERERDRQRENWRVEPFGLVR